MEIALRRARQLDVVPHGDAASLTVAVFRFRQLRNEGRQGLRLAARQFLVGLTSTFYELRGVRQDIVLERLVFDVDHHGHGSPPSRHERGPPALDYLVDDAAGVPGKVAQTHGRHSRASLSSIQNCLRERERRQEGVSRRLFVRLP